LGRKHPQHLPILAWQGAALTHRAIVFATKGKRRERLVLPSLAASRVLDYPRFFLPPKAA
jgi:hypothetical protein